VRGQEKKSIIELVHRDFERRVAQSSIKIHKKRLTLNDLKTILDQGGIPIILISTYHFDNNRTPHWVIVTAHDEDFIYIHDPDQTGEYEGVISRVHIPIAVEQFFRTTRFGKARISATVVVFPD
jgi:hypothetical protein